MANSAQIQGNHKLANNNTQNNHKQSKSQSSNNNPSQQNLPKKHFQRRTTLINPKKLVQDEELHELNNLYYMLNNECGQHNTEKKVKIVERSAKKGIQISEKDVNLLEMHENMDEESDIEENEINGQPFEIKLRQLDGHSLRKSPTQIANKMFIEHNNMQDDNDTIQEEKEEYMTSSSPYEVAGKHHRNLMKMSEDIDFENMPMLKLNYNQSLMMPELQANFSINDPNNANMLLRLQEPISPQSNSSFKLNQIQSKLKQSMVPMLRRNESNISMISDIVKKKRITFLKSASLFADEEEIFGSPKAKELVKIYQFQENIYKYKQLSFNQYLMVINRTNYSFQFTICLITKFLKFFQIEKLYLQILFILSVNLRASMDSQLNSPDSDLHQLDTPHLNTNINNNIAKHRKLIRRHLDDKKKLESAIEKMQIGGDRQILDTISKEIQFSREKEVIQKLLINKQNGGGLNRSTTNNKGDDYQDTSPNVSMSKLGPGGDSGSISSQRKTQRSSTTVDRSRQLKAKQEAHENAMAMLIEKVLSDPETRERLLDHSVLNDFFFEEKLKERRMQVLQEQRSAARRRGGRSTGMDGEGRDRDQNISLVSEVLDSLQHLPEVIRPEHIRVNLHTKGMKMMTSKDKDNMYHRNIVKSKLNIQSQQQYFQNLYNSRNNQYLKDQKYKKIWKLTLIIIINSHILNRLNNQVNIKLIEKQ